VIHLNPESLTANLFTEKTGEKTDPVYKLAANVFVSAIIDLATVLNEQPVIYSKWRLETLDFFLHKESLPFRFWCSVVNVNSDTARRMILQFLEVTEESLLECRSEVVTKCRRKFKNIDVVGGV
jgi:hypothetical protein